MPVLTARNLTKAYRGEPVLRGVSVALEPGRRYGLVGPNGGGKTTLASILGGLLAPDDGTVAISRDLRVACLPQRITLTPGRTAREEALDAFSDLIEAEARLRELEIEMAREDLPADRRAAAVRRHGELFARFEARGGWHRERLADTALAGLGVPAEARGRDVATLSGGQATRVALARTLLLRPDLLILDEPTNHLDLDAVEWLEEEVLSQRAACLIISHDRWFLDRVADEILELSNGRLHSYPGNYSKYELLREERLTRESKAFERQQEFIRKEEEFIRRNIASQRIGVARGKRTRLARLTRLSAPTADGGRMAIPGTEAPVQASDPLVLEDVAARVGDRELLSGLTLRVAQGQKLGIVGPNGVGKTTLLRLVVGDLMPSRGRVRRGPLVRTGYLAQEPAERGEPGTVLGRVWREMPGATGGEVRSWLARFLFRGEEADKELSALSGGEAARLALALLFLGKPNFLVLDEPTNHLDIAGREALEEALLDFPGAALVVTHDRTLLEGVADRVLEVRPDGFILTEGGWSDHLRRREEILRAAREAAPARAASKPEPERAAPALRPGRVRNPFRFAKLEEEIIRTEERIAEVLGLMGREEVYLDPGRLKSLKEELPRLEAALALLNEEWETYV
ncbi:MAG: ATP-binding cassette domain-containing protein [Planctomycetes bacterium]|nr:ATP-binding cassette domain-containing protein [Planctomycetota bacterium]